MSLGCRLSWICLGAALAAGACTSSEPDSVPAVGSAPPPADAGAVPVDAAPDAVVAADSPQPAPDLASDAGASPPGADAVPGAPATGCGDDNDCQLISDCCSCQAILRGEKAPSCDPNRSCVMSVCAQYQGLDRARCSAGRCVLGFDCAGPVMCKRLPPVCPLGQVPQVKNGCYGECVDARQCVTVAACAACRPGDSCVRAVAAPAGWHCQAPATANLGEM